MDTSARNLTVGLGIAVLLIAAIVFWMSRPAYGEISDKGYDFAMALGSACNGKNRAKVETISQMVDQSVAAGELSAEEAAWLQGIADKAIDGQWESAYAAVRRLMEEQTKKSTPLPALE